MFRFLLKLYRRRKYKRYLQSPEWKKKRNMVLKRDNYTCIICGSKKNLEAHHLYYPRKLGTEKLYSILTCCKKCHRQLHKRLDNINKK